MIDISNKNGIEFGILIGVEYGYYMDIMGFNNIEGIYRSGYNWDIFGIHLGFKNEVLDEWIVVTLEVVLGNSGS